MKCLCWCTVQCSLFIVNYVHVNLVEKFVYVHCTCNRVVQFDYVKGNWIEKVVFVQVNWDVHGACLCLSELGCIQFVCVQVNWVVQFDPPSNAESFVHRCGRTARIGNQVERCQPQSLIMNNYFFSLLPHFI